MFRFDIINHLIKINNFKNYLEIGVFDGECIKQIICENKDGVDPGTENGLAIGVNYRLSSDDFFEQNPHKIYDLIFIDGLHITQQVDLDIINALNQTVDNGIIILHDCSPPTEEHSLVPRQSIQWNGDVYKSVLKFRKNYNQHTLITVDTDWGVSIIFKNKLLDKFQTNVSDYDRALNEWNYFDENRKELLNLISPEEFLELIYQKPILKTTWNSGFFSCCTDRLRQITKFHHKNNVLPIVDSSEQWELYKDDGIENIQQWWGGIVNIFNQNDITDKFFIKKFDFESVPPLNFSSSVNYPLICNDDQYSNYHEINFEYSNKIVNTYFDFSPEIIEIEKSLITKYGIDLGNTLAVCYRGNDKHLETNLPSHDEMLNKIQETLALNNLQLLIQTDEQDFCDFIKKHYPEVIIIDETKKISRTNNAVQYTVEKGERVRSAQIFLAVMKIMSESNTLILNSGNVGLWITLFRRNDKNLIQFLHRKNQNSERLWIK